MQKALFNAFLKCSLSYAKIVQIESKSSQALLSGFAECSLSYANIKRILLSAKPFIMNFIYYHTFTSGVGTNREFTILDFSLKIHFIIAFFNLDSYICRVIEKQLCVCG